MAQIQKGTTFADGQLVTGARLNQLVDSAILNPEAIGDQTYVGAQAVDAGDVLIIKQDSSGLLKKALVSDILQSDVSIVTGQINSTAATLNLYNTNGSIAVSANKNILIESSDGSTNSGVGIELKSINANGDVKITATGNDITIDGATLAVTPRTTFSTTLSIKIPTGTTVQRPASPVVGDLRFNTTTGLVELYNGSAWATFGGNYALYEVYEATPTSFTASVSGSYATAWTSAAFTKPSNEIWTIELDTTATTGVPTNITNVRAKFGSGAIQAYDEVFGNSFGGSGTQRKHIYFKSIINAGTALTSETYIVEIQAANTPSTCSINDASFPAKFRIFKYKQ